MRGRLAVLASAALLASGGACAMSASEQGEPRCGVIGGELLPLESGGADALCSAIATATAKQAPGLKYNVEIRVLARSRLTALITMSDGRKLPEQNFVRMDKPLSRGSFDRFAATIAAEIAKTGTIKP